MSRRHGADGESSSPVFPRLAGQHAGSRAPAGRLSVRAAQERHHAPMVGDLTPADFALGRYQSVASKLTELEGEAAAKQSQIRASAGQDSIAAR